MSLAHPPYRRRNAAAVYAQHAGPNMTPMVDVVMVILIFFMASAAMLGPEWFLRTNLPIRGQASPGQDEPIRIRVTLSFDGDPAAQPGLDGATVATVEGEDSLRRVPIVAFEQWLAARVKALGADGANRLVVLVKPEAKASYDAVVRVHETCARLGVTKVGLADAD